MSSRSTPDISTLTRPIELGTPTVVQILNARSTATKEVVECLERECDAILECRICKSLFRSLANFISHKRLYCKGTIDASASLAQFYPSYQTPVLQPTDPDTDQLSLSHGSARSASNARKNIAPKKKHKPIRRTVPSDLSKITKTLPEIKLTAIEGVAVAVTQSVGPETDGRSSVATNDSDQLVTVQPKDGYPNMNLRQRGSKTDLKAVDIPSDFDDADIDDVDDYESRSARYKQPLSKAAIADALSKRKDCDFSKLKCLLCEQTFSTPKTLNFHMLNKHIKKKKFYPCIYCKNVFTQFWGVTRHLKRAHGLSGDSIDKIREKIRAKVYSDPKSAETKDSGGKKDNSSPSSSSEKSTAKSSKDAVAAASARNGQCSLCHKVFAKKQYLNQHMLACYKKAGMEPPSFIKRSPVPPEPSSSSVQSKQSKPLLFVCKTCNRAFSMRSNMMQHATACIKRNKDKTNTASSAEDGSKMDVDEESRTPTPTETESETNKPEAKKNLAEKISPPEIASPIPMTVEDLPEDDTVLKEGKEPKVSPKYYQDDMLFQLSPSDEAREEERSQTPPATPSSIAQSRPKRNVKPKRFYDGERVKIPEVVKFQQPDGTLVYKLREDVENSSKISDKNGKKSSEPVDNSVPGVIDPEAPDSPVEKEPAVKKLAERSSSNTSSSNGVDFIHSRNIKYMKGKLRIIYRGVSTPLLDSVDETKLQDLIDLKKLFCIKCKLQYDTATTLQRHAMRHLGYSRYKCTLCQFTTADKSECENHCKRNHQDLAADSPVGSCVIDLSSLVDESKDEGIVGRTVVLASFSYTENGGTKTRSRSKETTGSSDADTSLESREQNEAEMSVDSEQGSTTSDSKRVKGRPRKQDMKSSRVSSPLPQIRPRSANSPAHEKASSSAVPSPAPSRSSTSANSTPTRTRGRPRKQEIVTKHEAVELVSQDENNKRPRAKSNDAKTSAPPAKLVKIAPAPVFPVTAFIPEKVTYAELKKAAETKQKGASAPKPVEAVKPMKISSPKLEGLVSKLKTVRMPLSGTEGNSTSSTGKSKIGPGTESPEGEPADKRGDNVQKTVALFTPAEK